MSGNPPGRSQRPTGAAVPRQVALLVTITVLVLLPFADKAFHIDDQLFLRTAQQIHANPVDFYGFTTNLYGVEMRMADFATNPPLGAYYIALVAAVAGWTEVALHLAFMLPAVAAVLGTFTLARRWCAWPVGAALAGALTPVFVVSSTNVMADTLQLAFWVWAVALWVEGLERRAPLALGASALLIALAALTKYQGASLIPLLSVYTVVRRRALSRELLWLSMPIVILGAYQVFTLTTYGRGLFLDAAVQSTAARIIAGRSTFARALIGLAFTGGCLATVALYAPLVWSRRVLAAGLAVAGLGTVVIPYTDTLTRFSRLGRDGSVLVVVQLALLAVAGIHCLALAGADVWKRRDPDSLLLFLWMVGGFVFTSFVNSAVTARSVLPIAPVAGILVARRMERGGVTDPLPPAWRLVAPLVVGASLALLLAWNDGVLANSARHAVALVDAQYGRGPAPIWFQGHWGFQYYMESIGAKAVDRERPGLTSGDLMIVPVNNANTFAMPGVAMTLLRRIELPGPRWLTTMRPVLGASFYSEDLGPLPFAVGAVPPEQYYVVVIGGPARRGSPTP